MTCKTCKGMRVITERWTDYDGPNSRTIACPDCANDWSRHLPVESAETDVTGLRFCAVCGEDWPCAIRRKGPA